MSSTEGGTRISPRTFVLIAIAVVVGVLLLTVAACGMTGWLLFRGYKTVENTARVEPNPAWQPDHVIPADIGPNTIPGLTLPQITEALQRIGMKKSDVSAGMMSFSGQGAGFRYAATVFGDSPSSIDLIMATVDPAGAEPDRDNLVATSIKLFENIALIPTEGSGRKDLSTWLASTGENPGLSIGKDFGITRVRVQWYSEPHTTLILSKATGKPEVSHPITWKEDEAIDESAQTLP